MQDSQRFQKVRQDGLERPPGKLTAQGAGGWGSVGQGQPRCPRPVPRLAGGYTAGARRLRLPGRDRAQKRRLRLRSACGSSGTRADAAATAEPSCFCPFISNFNPASLSRLSLPPRAECRCLFRDLEPSSRSLQGPQLE